MAGGFFLENILRELQLNCAQSGNALMFRETLNQAMDELNDMTLDEIMAILPTEIAEWNQAQGNRNVAP